MKDIEKLFLGILLVALGVFVIYQSFYYHLIEIFTASGIVLLIIGLYFLSFRFFDNSDGIFVFLNKYNDNKSRKIKSTGSVHNHDNFPNSFFTKSSKISNEGGKIIDKVKITSKSKNPNEVLKKPISKAKNTDKKFKFVPHYERPEKIIRKPLKRSDLVDVSNAPDISKIPKVDKSKEIFEALASDDFVEPEHGVGDSGLVSDDFVEPEHNEGNSNVSSVKVQKSQKSDSDFSNSNNNESHNKDNNMSGKSQDTVPLDDLDSYVLTSEGVLSSKQIFERLLNNAKTEILLETSSIKEIAKELSSIVQGLNVRIIIQEHDLEDTSIEVLANSFLEKGVHIKVLPFINTTSLIVDEETALFVSENEVEEQIKVGALYDETRDVLDVKNIFEESWSLAADFN